MTVDVMIAAAPAAHAYICIKWYMHLGLNTTDFTSFHYI